MGNNMKQRALNLRHSMKAYLYPLACQCYYNLLVCYDTKHYTTTMLHMLCTATYMQKEYRAYMSFRTWYFYIPDDS